MMEAEEVNALASFSQVHDPCLGLLELKPQLGQDHRERPKGVLGLPLGVADRQQIVRLCRVAGYAESGLRSPVAVGFGG
jgi:hypothetical protein